MKQTETDMYLKQATRGLWGRKRKEVREELEAHLSERIMAHRIAGLGEADAVAKALSELGGPKEVSLGMARLYITLPTVAGSGVFFAAPCVLTLAAWPRGRTQLLKVSKASFICRQKNGLLAKVRH